MRRRAQNSIPERARVRRPEKHDPRSRSELAFPAWDMGPRAEPPMKARREKKTGL
ncbi:hypothetical protein GF318_02155 [Candidatus Micrarchaeota archaeon]|nr:hypothetical protein [Candidatus Micrarchaeota archaeon]